MFHNEYNYVPLYMYNAYPCFSINQCYERGYDNSMKKVMIALMMVVATSSASFAKTSNEQMKTAAKEVVQTVKDAPSGTTYGVVEVTKNQIVVNTPLGHHTINKNEDGSFSFLGMTAKLVSAKNGIYKVKTSLGTFSVNTRKATITKL